MSIKRKFLQILKDKGVSEYKFYKESGVSRGTLSNSSGMNEDSITKFFAYFPDIDANVIFNTNRKYPEEIDSNAKVSGIQSEIKRGEENILTEVLLHQIEDLKKDKEELRKINSIFQSLIETKLGNQAAS